MSTVAGIAAGEERLGEACERLEEAERFSLELPSHIGELGAVPSWFEPSAAISLKELAVDSS